MNFKKLSLCFSRRINSRYRDGFPRPVYGRVVHKQPVQPGQFIAGPAIPRIYDAQPPFDRVKPGYDDITRLYGNRMLDNQQQQQSQQPRRPPPKFRFAGGSSGMNVGSSTNNAAALGAAAINFGSTGINANLLTPQKGSFQRLKELVWTERAKELQTQRKNEEMAVRAAILKDLTNGQQ